jgi:hypothetical protein
MNAVCGRDGWVEGRQPDGSFIPKNRTASGCFVLCLPRKGKTVAANRAFRNPRTGWSLCIYKKAAEFCRCKATGRFIRYESYKDPGCFAPCVHRKGKVSPVDRTFQDSGFGGPEALAEE